MLRRISKHPIKSALIVTSAGLALKIGFNLFKGKRDIVFDIDETLVRAQDSSKPFPLHAGIKSPACDHILPPHHFSFEDDDKEKTKYNVWIRPHARWTLKILSRISNLYIFTAADKHYADTVINQSFSPGLFKGCYYRPSCVDPKGFGKDLTTIFKNDQDRDQDRDQNRDQDRVKRAILIDDRLFNRVDEQNLFHIKSYHPKNTLDFEMIKVLVRVLVF